MDNIAYICEDCNKKRKEFVQKFLNEYYDYIRRSKELFFKVKLEDGDKCEHAWIKVRRMGNETFSGLVDNELVVVKNYRYSQAVQFSRDDVEDILLDGKLISQVLGITGHGHLH
jgi:uncharacterized protein YegJ (DUF2314 family)